ncbi:hypothetical protein HDV57DRAFT_513361 [Trichoderma longibrachiatum]
MQCGQANIEAVVNEISIASIIAAHASSGLVPLLSKSCGHGYPLPCSRAEIEDMHLVMPYAPFTFDNAPWQDMCPSLKLALFRYALERLKNPHAAGIMHRDINPSNLLVFSLQPAAAAAIGDFGMAKVGSDGSEKSLGSLAYQAPEVATQETYTSLETQMPDGLATLLRAMLSRVATHQPSAEDALADAVWEQIAEADSVQDEALECTTAFIR